MNGQPKSLLSGGFLDLHLVALGGREVTVASVLVMVLILVASSLLSKLARRTLRRGMKARRVAEDGAISTTSRLVHYFIMAVGTVVALQTVGIDLSTLFAAGAVFAIALGFAMQNIAQNFVAGVILLIERTIKPGDVLSVDGRVVKVTRLGIRTTIARTLDSEEIIVPNAAIVQGTVINYTLQDSLYRVRSSVGVSYGSDLALVRRVLQAAAEKVPWGHTGQQPVILLTDFGNSSVNFEVSVWTDDPWRMRRAKSVLNEAVWWALKEAGITIAFPQLDVHFDAPPTADRVPPPDCTPVVERDVVPQ